MGDAGAGGAIPIGGGPSGAGAATIARTALAVAAVASARATGPAFSCIRATSSSYEPICSTRSNCT